MIRLGTLRFGTLLTAGNPGPASEPHGARPSTRRMDGNGSLGLWPMVNHDSAARGWPGVGRRRDR